MTQDLSQDHILEELTRRAQTMWGHDRPQLLRAALQDTARQLWEIRRHPPDFAEEPGFYQ